MRSFSLDLPDLESQLAELVSQIPVGQISTFGDVAKALGDVKAARWVATCLRKEDLRWRTAAHRVIRQTGDIADPDSRQLDQLRREGVATNAKGIDLTRAIRFQEFFGSAPLARLRAEQLELAKAVRLRPLGSPCDLIAGVDVSYRQDGVGCGAYVLLEMATLRIVWSHTLLKQVEFPYITGYLSFRELPIHAALLEAANAANRLTQVILVDGSGVLHPRGLGIASHLGVLADVATIGVTKHRLAGRITDASYEGTGAKAVIVGESILGATLPGAGGRKPIYVSPGHNCDVADAVSISIRCRSTHRLPEPIRLADRQSREAARDLTRRV